MINEGMYGGEEFTENSYDNGIREIHLPNGGWVETLPDADIAVENEFGDIEYIDRDEKSNVTTRILEVPGNSTVYVEKDEPIGVYNEETGEGEAFQGDHIVKS